MTATHPVIPDGLPGQLPDVDADGTQEWLASLDGVVDAVGPQRARYLMPAKVPCVRRVLARLAAAGQVQPAVVAEAASRYRLADPDVFPVGISAGDDS